MDAVVRRFVAGSSQSGISSINNDMLKHGPITDLYTDAVVPHPKFSLPVRLYVAGSSQSGKTSLIKGLLEHQSALFDRPFTDLYVFRKAHDELHVALQRTFPGNVFVVTGVDLDIVTSIEERVRPGANVLFFFDDLIAEVAESPECEALFYVMSGKFGLSLFLTSQNMFHAGKKLRNISLNINLFALTRNLRDETQVRRLAGQLYPENPAFLVDAYRKTMRLKPFNYLLIDLAQLTDDRLRVTTGVLPGEDRIYWLPKKRGQHGIAPRLRKP